MKTIIITIVLILGAGYEIFAQSDIENIVPHPRQAYERPQYSELFTIQSNMKINVDPGNPATIQALEFNRLLRERGIDTLEIISWDEAGINKPAIILDVSDGDVNDNFINDILADVPDQKIEVTASYPGPEGYVLDIMPTQMIIAGSDASGLHYGINSFFQLLDAGSGDRSAAACRVIDTPEFPVRWFYYSTNVYVGDNITTAKNIWGQASDLRFNGVALADSKFSRPTTLYPNYNDSLQSLKRFSAENYMNMIPCVMPFGYSNAILFHDPNLASGLPVRNQKILIESDTGKLVPAVDVALPNPGFEDYNGDRFPGFRYIDQPGEISFVDTEIKHSGNASIRMENFPEYQPKNGHGRIIYQTPVSPFKLYHIGAWVKTENFQPARIIDLVAIDPSTGISLNYFRKNIPATTDGWVRYDVTFNSLEADTLNIYWGVWGAKSGTIWWDDLVFEEVPFVNMLRRDGTPLGISHPYLDIAYFEGVDYETFFDPQTGNSPWAGSYNSYHTPPTFRKLPGGSIQNGDTLLFSYYHTVLIYNGQVIITMSDPKVYEIVEREFRYLDSVITATPNLIYPDEKLSKKIYFMEHDEIRVMNWDFGDQSRNMTPAEILADNVNKSEDIIRRAAPDADIWVWTDMFDEYHNAVSGNYYLVNGDLRGSADLIPKSTGMVNWNGRERDSIVYHSLDFFEGKGFRQISAPYYDNDENQIRRWKQWTRDVKYFHGMMYTTWQKRYDRLEPFAEYAWNHAPYIYHNPPFGVVPDSGVYLNIKINGDKWDKGWESEGAILHYRTGTDMNFTVINFQPPVGIDTIINLELPDENKWLQYYITATDNRGWTTKIPFGDSVYFELGELLTSVDMGNNPKRFGIVGISTNPVSPASVISYRLSKAGNFSLKLINSYGVEVAILAAGFHVAGNYQIDFDASRFSQGMYFIRLESEKGMDAKKIVVVD